MSGWGSGCCWLCGASGVVICGQVIALSLALVVGQVEVMKHLLLATFAPTSAKYCRDRFIPWTAVAACLILLACKNKSSASTLGVTPCVRIQEIQGFMSSAIKAIEKGHPWGMEHRC